MDGRKNWDIFFDHLCPIALCTLPESMRLIARNEALRFSSVALSPWAQEVPSSNLGAVSTFWIRLEAIPVDFQHLNLRF
jgi:hypothetical protein